MGVVAVPATGSYPPRRVVYRSHQAQRKPLVPLVKPDIIASSDPAAPMLVFGVIMNY